MVSLEGFKVDLISILELFDREKDHRTDTVVFDQTVRLFQFHRMVEAQGIDDVERLIVKVLKYFSAIKTFVDFTALGLSVNFIINTLRFTRTSDKSDYILEILEVLRDLLSKFRYTNRQFYIDNVIPNLQLIITSPHIMQNSIKKCCCDIVTLILTENTLCVECPKFLHELIVKTLEKIEENLLLGLELCRTFIKLCINGFDYRSFVFVFLKRNVSRISEIRDMEGITITLTTLWEMYNAFKECEDIKHITDGLIKHFTLFWSCLEHQNLQPYAALILIIIINRVFNIDGQLNKELGVQLTDGRWKIPGSDLFFFVKYIEFLYLGIDDDETVCKIVQARLTRNIHFDSPAVEKAVYLLYGAYCTDDKSIANVDLSCKLLIQLHRRENFEQVLTYHVSQLVWFLSRAPTSIMDSILKCWINNTAIPNKAIISACNLCNSVKYLVETFIRSKEQFNRERYAKLIKDIDDPLVPTILMNFLVTVSTPDIQVIDFIFTQDLVPPNNETYGLRMMKYLSVTIPRMQSVETLKSMCAYTLKIMIIWKRTPEILLYLYQHKFVTFLTTLCSKEDNDVAVETLKLLREMIISQNIHRIDVDKTKILEFSQLLIDGPNDRLKHSLNLLHSVLASKSVMPIIKLHEPSLDLNTKLLELRRNETHSNKAYQMLAFLLSRQTYLAKCVKNWLAIEQEMATGGVHNRKYFLRFFKICVKIVSSNTFINYIPPSEIQKYLKSVQGGNSEASEINSLLWRWQNSPNYVPALSEL